MLNVKCCFRRRVEKGPGGFAHVRACWGYVFSMCEKRWCWQRCMRACVSIIIVFLWRDHLAVDAGFKKQLGKQVKWNRAAEILKFAAEIHAHWLYNWRKLKPDWARLSVLTHLMSRLPKYYCVSQVKKHVSQVTLSGLGAQVAAQPSCVLVPFQNAPFLIALAIARPELNGNQEEKKRVKDRFI